MAHRKVLKPLLAAIKAFFNKLAQRSESTQEIDHDAEVPWVDLAPPGWGEDSE